MKVSEIVSKLKSARLSKICLMYKILTLLGTRLNVELSLLLKIGKLLIII